MEAPARTIAGLSDKYTIERELGRGGMAAVYLAEDVRHGRKVALKVLDASVAGSMGIERFLREIRIAARLAHPHIVPLYDSGASAGTVFYVMPYVAGQTLRERLARGPMPLRDVLRAAREVASALDYAHRQGIVHRDIKPDNVMLTEGHAMITDFGVARAIAEATQSSITSVGMTVGTPAYMSPEQCGGDETPLDGRCDQYAFACVLYEMISGKPPFTGATAMSLLAQHLTATPQRLSAPEPVPAAVEQAIMRALAKSPAERFATLADLADALGTGEPDARLETVQLPVAVSPARPARLPVPLTPLVGREREAQTIAALLRQNVRLVTLHGPGGIGKTRLALEVASREMDLFADGAWFVALAEVRTAESLTLRIAQTVGLRGPSATAAALRDHLRDRNALLILDNFEQLGDAAAAEVSALLGECPALAALVTSQALLHVYGEHEFRVEPLPIPDPRLNPESLREAPAATLFLQRAIAARPDFVLDADNASAIAEICELLDGVPLAIELAAARVRTTTPQALLPKLRLSLTMLTGGARDVPERQRTMRNAVAWSHGLLTDHEREVFRRMAVFAGGVTARSALEVCIGHGSELAEDILEGLADRSLVRRQVDAMGEARYTMLRPVQAFALEMLDEAGERRDVEERHAAFFCALALESEAQVARGDDKWLDRLESDHENLRLAMTHLVDRGRGADALRMGVALWRYWDARTYAREGLDLLRVATEHATSDIPVPLRLTALFSAGVLADSCGDLEQARQFFERHLRLTTEQGDPAAIGIANSNVGIVRLRLGEIDEAVPLLEVAVRAMRQVKNPQALAMGLANVGNAERVRRNFDVARARYGEAKEIFERIGDRVNVAWSLSHLGDLARDEGNVGEARARYRESVDIFSSLGHKRGLTSVLTDLGELLASQGMVLDARGCLEEALVQVADVGDQRAMLRVFEVMAGIACSRQDDERAVRIAGAVAGLRDRLGAPMSAADRQRLQDRISASLIRLDTASRERTWRRGVEMSIEDVITYVTAAASQTPQPTAGAPAV